MTQSEHSLSIASPPMMVSSEVEHRDGVAAGWLTPSNPSFSIAERTLAGPPGHRR